jgi:hypothetical protein
MTYLFYRKTRVPRIIDDLVMPILNESIVDFRVMRQAADKVFASRQFANDWRETATALLRQYNKLMLLDGILNGDSRLSNTIIDRRFGVDSYYIGQLKKYSKEN